MKKILYFSLILLFISTGCGSMGIQNQQNKTEYNINEEAFIDHFQITCTSYEELNQVLKVNFIVTNNSDSKSEINSQTDFKLSISNSDTMNSSENKKIVLAPSETKEISVTFDLASISLEMKKPYKALFYSNVVSNNIGFILE